MTTAERDDLHGVLNALEDAGTAGRAIDALPEGWRMFLTGPDGEGADACACSILPAGVAGPPERIYRRGYAMGRGATRMEAIVAAVVWLRDRTPQRAHPGERPVLRICDRCDTDQTPLGRGLHAQLSARGISIGLFCDACIGAAAEAVRTVDRAHGAMITPEGQYLSSPRGTPFSPKAYEAHWRIPARPVLAVQEEGS